MKSHQVKNSLIETNNNLMQNFKDIRVNLLTAAEKWNVSKLKGTPYTYTIQDENNNIITKTINLPKTAHQLIIELDHSIKRPDQYHMTSVWRIRDILQKSNQESKRANEYSLMVDPIQKTCENAVVWIEHKLENEFNENLRDQDYCIALKDIQSKIKKIAVLPAVDRLTKVLEYIHDIKHPETVKFFNEIIFNKKIFIPESVIKNQKNINSSSRKLMQLESELHMKGIIENKHNAFAENFAHVKLLIENKYIIRSPDGRYKFGLEELKSYHESLPEIIMSLQNLKNMSSAISAKEREVVIHLLNEAQYALNVLSTDKKFNVDRSINSLLTSTSFTLYRTHLLNLNKQSVDGLNVVIDSKDILNYLYVNPLYSSEILVRSADEMNKFNMKPYVKKNIVESVNKSLMEKIYELSSSITLHGAIIRNNNSFYDNFNKVKILLESGYNIKFISTANVGLEIKSEHFIEYHKQLPELIQSLENLKAIAINSPKELTLIIKLQREACYALNRLNVKPFDIKPNVGLNHTVSPDNIDNVVVVDPLQPRVYLVNDAKHVSQDAVVSSLPIQPVEIKKSHQLEAQIWKLKRQLFMEGIIDDKEHSFANNFNKIKTLLENNYLIKTAYNETINFEYLATYYQQLPDIINSINELHDIAMKIAPQQIETINLLLNAAQFVLDTFSINPPKLKYDNGLNRVIAPEAADQYLYEDSKKPGVLLAKLSISVKPTVIFANSQSIANDAKQIVEERRQLERLLHMRGAVGDRNSFFIDFVNLKTILEAGYRISAPDDSLITITQLIDYHNRLPMILESLENVKVNAMKLGLTQEINLTRKLLNEARFAFNILNTNAPQLQSLIGLNNIVSSQKMSQLIHKDSNQSNTLRVKDASKALFITEENNLSADHDDIVTPQSISMYDDNHIRMEALKLAAYINMNGLIDNKNNNFYKNFTHMKVLLENAYVIKSPIIDYQMTLDKLNQYHQKLPMIIKSLQKLIGFAKNVAPQELNQLRQLKLEAQFALDTLNINKPSPMMKDNKEIVIFSNEMTQYLYNDSDNPNVIRVKNPNSANTSVTATFFEKSKIAITNKEQVKNKLTELTNLVSLQGAINKDHADHFSQAFKQVKKLLENDYSIKSNSGALIDLNKIINYHKQLPMIIQSLHELKAIAQKLSLRRTLQAIKLLQQEAQLALDILNSNPPKSESSVGARSIINYDKLSNYLYEDPSHAGLMKVKDYLSQNLSDLGTNVGNDTTTSILVQQNEAIIPDANNQNVQEIKSGSHLAIIQRLYENPNILKNEQEENVNPVIAGEKKSQDQLPKNRSKQKKDIQGMEETKEKTESPSTISRPHKF